MHLKEKTITMFVLNWWRSNMIRKARDIGKVFDLNDQKFKVIKGDCEKCYFINDSFFCNIVK